MLKLSRSFSVNLTGRKTEMSLRGIVQPLGLEDRLGEFSRNASSLEWPDSRVLASLNFPFRLQISHHLIGLEEKRDLFKYVLQN